jgi:hypothetical protein
MSLRWRAVVQFFFALLLLFAQQGALTHDIWHAAKSGVAYSALAGDQKTPESKKNRLCDLHSALGNVLGAVAAVPAAAPLEACANAPSLAAAAPALSLFFLAASSRGPPALL